MPPTIPLNINAGISGADSITIGWNSPQYDGGIAIGSFLVEIDTSPTFISSDMSTITANESDNSVCTITQKYSTHHEESHRRQIRISDQNLIDVGIITYNSQILIENEQYKVEEIGDCGGDCLTLDREVGSLVDIGSRLFIGFETRMHSHRIDDLTPGRDYFVRVTAENLHGLHGPPSYYGYPSDAIAVVPMSVPF
eukprot:1011950_1